MGLAPSALLAAHPLRITPPPHQSNLAPRCSCRRHCQAQGPRIRCPDRYVPVRTFPWAGDMGFFSLLIGPPARWCQPTRPPPPPPARFLRADQNVADRVSTLYVGEESLRDSAYESLPVGGESTADRAARCESSHPCTGSVGEYGMAEEYLC